MWKSLQDAASLQDHKHNPAPWQQGWAQNNLLPTHPLSNCNCFCCCKPLWLSVCTQLLPLTISNFTLPMTLLTLKLLSRDMTTWFRKAMDFEETYLLSNLPQNRWVLSISGCHSRFKANLDIGKDLSHQPPLLTYQWHCCLLSWCH